MLIRELQAQAKAAGKKTFKTGNVCKKCGTDEKYTSGRTCRQCQLDRMKALDPEHIRAKNKKYYLKHREEILVQKEDYRTKNRKRVRQSDLEYRTRMLKQDPYAVASKRGYSRARNYSPKNIPGDLTPAEVIKITYPFYFVSRRWQEETKQKLEVDHIIPLRDGGMHHPDNLQVLTLPEHRAKTQAEHKARELKDK